MSKLGTLWHVGRTFGVRGGFRRLEYELKRGSGQLSRRMDSVRGWQTWDLRYVAPKVSPDDLLSSRRQGAHSFFFSDPRNLAGDIKEILGDKGQKSVIADADKILTGSLPYFGRLWFSTGFPPKWFENPVTQQRVSPDRSWTQMRFASEEYGDLKFILEPSRFLFVYPLVRAYAISSDERYPKAFWAAVENWAEQSPPMSGPLWICGQESSMRILAWSFGLYAFIRSEATTPTRVALLLSMIAAHAWRTEQTVGYAQSQRSNHLFTEAVGLWTAGTLYPELKEAKGWQELGARLLEEAALDQIAPEGVHLQYSFNYQRMILQLLLWTIRVAEIHEIQLAPAIYTRASAALEFLAQWVDPASGRAPNYGSNDGTNIVPLSETDYGDFRPLLGLGEHILGRPAGLAPGPWDESALWLSANKAKAMPSQSGNTLSSSAGYYRLGGKNSWAMVRAGRYTRRPFQADQLHVDLWWRGLNLARDAGTYLYNGEPPWNNGLAGTAAHNTVMVDGRDQMRRAGRFLWLDWAQATGRASATTGGGAPDCFQGEHDGYGGVGVTHRRMVRRVNEDAWVIVDDLLGAGAHEARLHWLLPDLPIEIVSNLPFSASLQSEGERIRWNIFSSAPGSAAIIRAGQRLMGESIGGDESLLGWESPTYGELRAAVSMTYRMKTQLPARIITVVAADDSIQVRVAETRLEIWCGDSKAYECEIRPASTQDSQG
jgi:asparagine synthase (glutamine-hydrolysing)